MDESNKIALPPIAVSNPGTPSQSGSPQSHPFHVGYQVPPPPRLAQSLSLVSMGSHRPRNGSQGHMALPPVKADGRQSPPAAGGNAGNHPEALLLPSDPSHTGPLNNAQTPLGRAPSRAKSAFQKHNPLPLPPFTPDGQCLHMRLLKERIELEVAMRREGLRCVVFSAFVVCLCVSLSISTATIDRNASRWMITQGLGLDDIEDVSMPSDVYDYMTHLSSNSRSFFVLSSAYTENPLAAVLVHGKSGFASGPLQVPSDAHPQLRLFWSMTTWTSLQSSYGGSSEKSLIVRKYLPRDDSGLSCWAWYTKGYSKLVLEYGRHNLDEGYVEIELDFPSTFADFEGSEGQMQLSGIAVNGTHVTGFMQKGDEVLATVAVLKSGFPTDCPSGSMEVGAANLELADLKFHPKALTATQVTEIMQGGQTLEDIATGVSPNPAPELSEESTSQDTDSTQALIISMAEDQMALSQVLGNLLSSGLSGLSDQISDLAGPDEPSAIFVPNLEGAGSLFVSVVGGYPEALVTPASPSAPTADLSPVDLTSSFREMVGAQPADFTLGWWAKADKNLEDMTELRFLTPEGTPLLTVDYAEGKLYKDVPGWTFQFHGSPYCFGEAAANFTGPQKEQCRSSPSWWCQAPSGDHRGTYDGIWRHFALRYKHGDVGKSSLDMFQDGRLLCGAVFDSSNALVPQGTPTAPSTVAFALANAADSTFLPKHEFLLKDMRLYPTALTSTDIESWGLDSELAECLDLSVYKDNPKFETYMGMSCYDIHKASDEGGAALSACITTPEIKEKCPVSCVGSGNPFCWDRMPPLQVGEVPEPVSPVEIDYSGPRRYMAEFLLPELSTAAAPMLALQTWSDNTTGTWVDVMDSVKYVQSSTTFPSTDSGFSLEGGAWLTNDGSFSQEMWWLDATCPEPADESAATKLMYANICSAEKSYRGILHDLLETSPAETASQLDRLTTLYPGGYLSSGHSYSLWYWARVSDLDDGKSPSFAGIDGEQNICFFIQGDRAYIPAKGGPCGNLQEKVPITVQLGDASLTSGAWAFFALVFDVERGMVTFSINDDVIEVPFQSEQWENWGCEGLKYVINTGTEAQISPIRLAMVPIMPGSLQQLYLSMHQLYDTAITGPEVTTLTLLERSDRPRSTFPLRTMAISPPLALQQRVNHSATHLFCQGETVDAVNIALVNSRTRQCQYPYVCSDEEFQLRVPCPTRELPTASKFMARNPVSYNGGDYFPEFMWVLENNILVRGEADLNPRTDYIDLYTLDLEFLFTFLTPDTRIATVLLVQFDLSGSRLEGDYSFMQVKMLDKAEHSEWLGWTVSATILVFISMLLAIPACILEVKDIVRGIQKYLQRNRVKRLQSTERPRYTADTTQPDLFDVLLCLALFIFMLVMLVWMSDQQSNAPKAFAVLAEQDWASGEPFYNKTLSFLANYGVAIQIVQEAEQMRTVAFWMLILCCVRIIIYLKIHPRIAGVTQTFEVVSWELMNFFFSFGIIYMFLAYIAHIKFGYQYDEFATFEMSLVTQFSILIGGDSPDYTSDRTLFVYVVGYVFVCTLALLNFLLAIVVAGYDSVREQALENQVVISFMEDTLCVFTDGVAWLRHRSWPSKMALLNALANTYPDVFGDTESTVVSSEEEFVSLVMHKTAKPVAPSEARELFMHYFRFDFLRADKHQQS